MNIKEIKERAIALEKLHANERQQDYFTDTIAMLIYLGLLRHNKIKGKRINLNLQDVLKATKLEPRIYELLPAVLIGIPDAIYVEEEGMPQDLLKTITAMKKRKPLKEFRGIPAEKYMQWLHSPVLDLAKKRFDFRSMPRKRQIDTSEIGEFIRTQRIKNALTQKQLATMHKVSLRVIRDIEQGKEVATISNANKILAVFGSRLTLK